MTLIAEAHLGVAESPFRQEFYCRARAPCSTDYPVCWDYSVPSGTNDCVRDACVDHCCSVDDCPDVAGGSYYCDRTLFSSGDYNVCLYKFSAGTAGEGAACSVNGDCRSNFCAPGANVCRRRCCTDEDCTTAAYPNCTVEAYTRFGITGFVNVCTP